MATTKKRRKIMAFTGSRSEYDLQYSVARSLAANPAVDFSYFVFGAHLSERLGLTVTVVENDGFRIAARCATLLDSDSLYAKAKSAAILFAGICDALQEHRPDMIMVAGDREETVVAALASNYMNIPVCHLFGGDKTYPDNTVDVDEQVRHATTKLAHLHFPVREEHRDRILALGEEPWRVHCFGSPALDKYRLSASTSLRAINKHFGIDVKKGSYAVMIHHPMPGAMKSSMVELENTLKALAGIKIPVFISFPNSDPGNQAFIAALEKAAAQHPDFILYKNLDRSLFNPLIANARFLIGNSSMGIMECPYLGIPAVNVGSRQQKRLQAGNVIFTTSAIASISSAIHRALHDRAFHASWQKNQFFYGDGRSGEKIARIMTSASLTPEFLAKQITF